MIIDFLFKFFIAVAGVLFVVAVVLAVRGEPDFAPHGDAGSSGISFVEMLASMEKWEEHGG